DLRARRHASNASTVSLMAAPASFVRFQLGEFSPRTLIAADVTRASPYTIDWRAGGELFITHAPARIVPDSLDIVGPRSLTADLREGWSSQPGLTAGRYTLRRVYVGGLRTDPVSAVVDAGKSTDVGLPLEDVGGLRVGVDPAACQPGDR